MRGASSGGTGVSLGAGDAGGVATGAALAVDVTVLSATGLAFRRCQLVRVDDDEIAVNFLKERELQNRKSTGQFHE